MTGVDFGWTCHVCGSYRADEFISVHKRDCSYKLGLPAGTAQENIRYCNDKQECKEGAKDTHHVKVNPHSDLETK